MDGVIRGLAVAAGLGVSLWVLRSAIRTVVLPRSESVPLTRLVFLNLRRAFDLMAREQRSYEARDRVMAFYAPLGLMLLAATWALCVILAFTLVFWGLGTDPLRQAFVTSGSSFTTLGFAPPRDVPTDIAAVGEAIVGLGLVALLISFLPSIYGAFQRREVMVSMLQVRAGSPPTGVELITRLHSIGMLERDFGAAADLFKQWEAWFSDIEESHTSQGALPFFRSPQAHRHWVTASGRSSTARPSGSRPSRDLLRRTLRCACAPGTCRCVTSPTSSASTTIPTRRPTIRSASSVRSSTTPAVGWRQPGCR